MSRSLVLLALLAGGCSDAPEGPTLDGTVADAPEPIDRSEAVTPEDSLRSSGGLAPEGSLAPDVGLAPEGTLSPGAGL